MRTKRLQLLLFSEWSKIVFLQICYMAICGIGSNSGLEGVERWSLSGNLSTRLISRQFVGSQSHVWCFRGEVLEFSVHLRGRLFLELNLRLFLWRKKSQGMLWGSRCLISRFLIVLALALLGGYVCVKNSNVYWKFDGGVWLFLWFNWIGISCKLMRLFLKPLWKILTGFISFLFPSHYFLMIC